MLSRSSLLHQQRLSLPTSWSMFVMAIASLVFATTTLSAQPFAPYRFQVTASGGVTVPLMGDPTFAGGDENSFTAPFYRIGPTFSIEGAMVIGSTPLMVTAGYEMNYINVPPQFGDLRLDIIRLGLQVALRDLGHRFVPYVRAGGGLDVGHEDGYALYAGLGLDWRVSELITVFGQTDYLTIIDHDIRMLNCRLGIRLTL